MLATGLILGFLSNLHCLGMCGPIALILPVDTMPLAKRVGAVSMYNLGRIISYAALGAVFGLMGKAFVLSGLHQTVSIVIGVVMVLSIAIPFMLSKRFKQWLNNSRLMNGLRSSIAQLLKSKNFAGYLLLGIMNGLLPCGMVYIAVAGALVTGDVLSGIAYMALFGLGTLPIMVTLPLFKGNVLSGFKNQLKWVLPTITFLLGCTFIVRGMGLDIPYLSPDQEVLKIQESTMVDGKEVPKKSCH